jgi:hypothetical protein
VLRDRHDSNNRYKNPPSTYVAQNQKRTSSLKTWFVNDWRGFCSPYDAEGAIAAGSGGEADLGVAIIRITPAPAFEEAVCGRNPTQGDPIGQFAARINPPPPKLAHI